MPFLSVLFPVDGNGNRLIWEMGLPKISLLYVNDFVHSGIWNTDIFTNPIFVIIYLIYESLKTHMLKASLCPPSIWCFRYNIQKTTLIKITTGWLLASNSKNHQYQELNQDDNFSISISVLWEPPCL